MPENEGGQERRRKNVGYMIAGILGLAFIVAIVIGTVEVFDISRVLKTSQRHQAEFADTVVNIVRTRIDSVPIKVVEIQENRAAQKAFEEKIKKARNFIDKEQSGRAIKILIEMDTTDTVVANLLRLAREKEKSFKAGIALGKARVRPKPEIQKEPTYAKKEQTTKKEQQTLKGKPKVGRIMTAIVDTTDVVGVTLEGENYVVRIKVEQGSGINEIKSREVKLALGGPFVKGILENGIATFSVPKKLVEGKKVRAYVYAQEGGTIKYALVLPSRFTAESDPQGICYHLWFQNGKINPW